MRFNVAAFGTVKCGAMAGKVGWSAMIAGSAPQHRPPVLDAARASKAYRKDA